MAGLWAGSPSLIKAALKSRPERTNNEIRTSLFERLLVAKRQVYQLEARHPSTITTALADIGNTSSLLVELHSLLGHIQ